jgi:hypothetical protein
MTVLRVIAVLIAIGGIVDPAVTLSRPLPAQVRLHVDPADQDAVGVAARLRASVKDRVAFGTGPAAPALTKAEVFVGRASSPAAGFASPTSVVTFDDRPGVEIVAAPSAVHAALSSSTPISVTIRARGLAGQTTVVGLEDAGVELARVEHRWTRDETATIELPYLALATGTRRLSIRAAAAEGERRLFDNRADLLALVAPRQGRVAVIEPRPSWPAGFVRRSLEGDPAFAVSSLLRTSTDVASRAGAPPGAMAFEQLLPFEVIVVGAPEELRASEVDALRRFAERRGGTVLLLPDRRPSGEYVDLLPGRATEQLLSEPRALEPAGLTASEIVSIPPSPGMRTQAALNGMPVVVSWAVGEGRFLFSGALDAWRYRADPRSRSFDFWRDAIMSGALAAPHPLEVEIEPAIVRPGTAARVVARIRPTEFGAAPDASSFVVQAHVTDPGGRETLVRLHPTPVPGTLEGSLSTAAAGIHNVTVSMPGGARAQTVLIADADASSAPEPSDVLERVPELTGGVTVASSDLSSLVHHLTTIPRASHQVAVHPMRSAWWMVAFVAALCGEWTMRRRRGLR